MSIAHGPEWATSSVPFDEGRLYYGPMFGVLQVSQGYATGDPSEPITVSTGDTRAFDDPVDLRQLAADALTAAEWLEANR